MCQLEHGIKVMRIIESHIENDTEYENMEITSPTHSYDEIVMSVSDVQDKLYF